MGTPALALPTLAAIAAEHDVVAVVTQPDRAAGRGRKLQQSPVKEWAVAAAVPAIQPGRIGEPAVVKELGALGVDVAVVVAFGQLLPATVLAIPRLGSVNLHASLLPRHRGASPIQAAILEGDVETGVTTMLMDEGLDTGPILQRRVVSMHASDTAETLGERLGAAGPALMLDTLAGLARGTLDPEPQGDSHATMTRLIRKTDGEIDWTRPAEEVDRRVRAMQPWPVAFTTSDDERLRVWAVDQVEGGGSEIAGTVLASEAGLVVAAGQGSAVRILELQRMGGRRMPAEDFLRGHPLPPGTALGSGAT